LSDPQIAFPEGIQDWFDIEEMWGTVDNFLSKSVSYCVLHDNRVVAWCVPDCVVGDRIDVGIFTDPRHRRRGLASVAVDATVEHCLNHGFSAVGWHCNAENVASWKTAEKVGFVRNRAYAYYYYMYDPIDHLAELGWYHYRQGDYGKTVQYYERVFAQRENNPGYYYHLAASAWALLGDREQALKFLSAAVDHDWADAEFTGEQEEFEILHDAPEWTAILERMQAA
jgi:GNAT superfamily N-acetyltransferase